MEEIFLMMGSIFENLNIGEEIDDIEYFFNEKIYLEIYKILFPFLASKLELIDNLKSPSGHKIQGLIDLLAKDILTMDLSHIKGYY